VAQTPDAAAQGIGKRHAVKNQQVFGRRISSKIREEYQEKLAGNVQPLSEMVN